MNVNYCGESNKVEFSEYPNGRIKITLIGRYSNKKIEATVNDEDIYLRKDEVLIKNYSENQGVEDALDEGNIIGREPTEVHSFGYTGYKVFKLTGESLRRIKINSRLNNNSAIVA